MGESWGDPRDRRALLGLWAIPGIGPKTLARLQASASGPLREWLDVPVSEWSSSLDLPAAVRRRLTQLRTLDEVAAVVGDRAQRAQISIAFAGDDAYPSALLEATDAPPLLFWKGSIGAPRRRLAMVGSRHPDSGFLPTARAFAREIAEAGIGVVSGAAQGVDRACHFGALDGGGETWAFVGSALDELDPAQAKLLPRVLDGGGAFFTELPPGVRASPATFPRRNRLISGSSNAVLILRASAHSGSLHTALAAVIQGRTLLALPGERANDAAHGCNALIRAGRARLCLSVEDAIRATGAKPGQRVEAAQEKSWELSIGAKSVLGQLSATPISLEHLLQTAQVPSDALVSALCELELAGRVHQLPGKLYERV